MAIIAVAVACFVALVIGVAVRAVLTTGDSAGSATPETILRLQSSGATTAQLTDAMDVVRSRLSQIDAQRSTSRVVGSEIVIALRGVAREDAIALLTARGVVQVRPVRSMAASDAALSPPTVTGDAAVTWTGPPGRGSEQRLLLGPAVFDRETILGGIGPRSSDPDDLQKVSVELALSSDERLRDVRRRCAARDAGLCPLGVLALTMDGLVLATPSLPPPERTSFGHPNYELLTFSDLLDRHLARISLAAMTSGPLPVRLDPAV